MKSVDAKKLLSEAARQFDSISKYCIERDARGYTISPVEFLPDDADQIVRAAIRWYENNLKGKV